MKTASEMTYIVSGGALTLLQPIQAGPVFYAGPCRPVDSQSQVRGCVGRSDLARTVRCTSVPRRVVFVPVPSSVRSTYCPRRRSAADVYRASSATPRLQQCCLKAGSQNTQLAGGDSILYFIYFIPVKSAQ